MPDRDAIYLFLLSLRHPDYKKYTQEYAIFPYILFPAATPDFQVQPHTPACIFPQ